MPLTVGAHFGPYEILAAVGAGGMGEVYRAHDTTLGRDVALKILPEALVANPDSLARFEREARALGALNHSNIAQIYGVEAANHSRALIMELVNGATLEEVLRAGPLPSSKALPLARGFSSPIRRIPGGSSRSRAGRSRSRSNTRRSGSDGLK
jgi:serine/threonine protein kinase